MLATMEAVNPRRRALRRSVRIECAAQSEHWDDAAPFVATDLSPFGIWLNTELALEVGERITLSFRPPHWPVWSFPVTVRAEIVRVGLPRRRNDRGMAGMGLCFVDLERADAARMAELMLGLPPPLPSGLPEAVLVVEPELIEREETELVCDGMRFELYAEAPLLTLGRRKASRARAKVVYKLARTRHRARRRVGRHRQTLESSTGRKPKLRLVS